MERREVKPGEIDTSVSGIFDKLSNISEVSISRETHIKLRKSQETIEIAQ